MNKPRRFYISPIYIDERQERLDAIRRQARTELAAASHAASPSLAPSGLSAGSASAYDAGYLRGAFRSAQRSRRVGAWLWAPVLLAALALLLIIGVMLSL